MDSFYSRPDTIDPDNTEIEDMFLPEDGIIDDIVDELNFDSDGILTDADLVLPQFVGSPTVTINTNPAVPQAGLIEVASDIPSRVRATLAGPDGIRALHYAALATEHRLPILELLPESTYTVSLSIVSKDGAERIHPKTFTLEIPPLPSVFPSIKVTTHGGTPMEPGYAMLVMSKSTEDGDTLHFGYKVVAIDTIGRVRWYHQDETTQHGLEFLQNGNLLLQFNKKIIEIDMFGDLRGEWLPEQQLGTPDAVTIPGVVGFHHSASPVGEDRIIVLSAENRMIENYPTSETDPDAPHDTVAVRGDLIIDFDRAGNTRPFLHLFDILDPLRIAYGTIRIGNQWSHSNYLLPIADDDSVLLSVRHQSCLVKFDRQTGVMHWILGNHDGWTTTFLPYLLNPVGAPFEWQWYQHNPKYTTQGTFILFDNGNYRAMPYDIPVPAIDNWSRVVEYRVHEDTMTVEQTWEWYPDSANRIYAPFLGDVEELPVTGNILVTFGGISLDSEGKPTDEQQGVINHAHLFEVTHTEPSVVVREILIDDTSTSENGWLVHRATFRSSLYPEGMLEE